MKLVEKLLSTLKKKDAPARPFCTAVLAAAGSSARMGGENKLLLELGGVPVAVHALRALEACPDIDEIVVVTRSADILAIASLAKEFGISKVSHVLTGGASRQESVYIGAQQASQAARLIAVHDAARPLADAALISRVVRTAAQSNAAIAAVPLKDTLKVVRDGMILSTPVREELYAAQTPQVFDADLLRAALQSAQEHGRSFTDDSSAVEAMGVRVHIAQGSYENIKITTPEDMACVQALLEAREGE